MGQKNRQHTITQGRRSYTPPATTPGPRDKLKAQNARSARESELERQLAAEQAGREADRFRHQIADVVLLNAQALKLDKVALTSLDRSVEHALEDHLKAGKALKAFDPYAVVSNWKARHGRALDPPRKHASPLESALPPPRTEARVMPNDRKAHDQALSAYQERGARHREEDIKRRERYDARLRELGLANPAIGSTPGTGSGPGY
jgi:hypothetical protein